MGDPVARRLMTRYAPQSNSATPYIQALHGFLSGGLPAAYNAAVQHQQRWGMPGIGSQVSDIASKLASVPINAAMTGPRLMGDVMGGQIDPNSPEAIGRAADTALGVMGGGAFGAERGALGMAGGKGITAFHGSPHDFDAFDLAKIGTGEGAQAYGHGLYFAENPQTAEQYKKAFDARSGAEQDAKMYQVSINADPEHFLDWDRPLSEQSPKVQEALTKSGLMPQNPSNDISVMAHLLRGGDTPLRSQEDITNGLRAAGIPGIKYLDQGSRNAGLKFEVAGNADGSFDLIKHGGGAENVVGNFKTRDAANAARDAQMPQETRNYVVFDDKLIDIMKKYGIAGVGALPALGAYHFQDADLGDASNAPADKAPAQ